MFYARENVDNLKLLKEEENYDYLNGFKVDGFISGKTYFYKIVSKYDGDKVESKIESFTKINRTNLNPKAKWAKNAVFYEERNLNIKKSFLRGVRLQKQQLLFLIQLVGK